MMMMVSVWESMQEVLNKSERKGLNKVKRDLKNNVYKSFYQIIEIYLETCSLLSAVEIFRILSELMIE